MQKTIKLLVFMCFICLARPGLCDSADRPTTAVLRFEPGGFSESIAAAKGEVEFSDEPKYAGTDLVRGSIQVGTHKMGYVLDQSTKTLYLDLNMNGNLTDDPAGVITDKNRNGSNGADFIDFNNVPVSLKANGLTIPYELSIIFSMGHPMISMRSGWSGDVELSGRKWRVEVADDLDGKFSRSDVFRLNPAESSERSRIELGDNPRIYLDNHLYQLNFSFVPASDKADVLVEFKPVKTETGRVHIEGKDLKRLVLADTRAKIKAIYDSPSADLDLPAGNWMVIEAVLKGPNQTYNLQDYSGASVSVKPGQTANLKVGGPLRNSAEIVPQGSGIYVFNFKVVDQAGRAWKPAGNPDYQNKPQLEILKNGKKVISASFEYG